LLKRTTNSPKGKEQNNAGEESDQQLSLWKKKKKKRTKGLKTRIEVGWT